MKSITKTFQIVDKETGQILEERTITQQYRIEATIKLTEDVAAHRYDVYHAGMEFDIVADSMEKLTEGDEYCAEDHAGVETIIPVSSATLIRAAYYPNNFDSVYFNSYFPTTLPVEEP